MIALVLCSMDMSIVDCIALFSCFAASQRQTVTDDYRNIINCGFRHCSGLGIGGSNAQRDNKFNSRGRYPEKLCSADYLSIDR